jgi:hypothetical protein
MGENEYGGSAAVHWRTWRRLSHGAEFVNPIERVTLEGEAILRFDKALVARLVDHARNSPESRANYGDRDAKPALWLVGDAGVYLMSNGSPAIAHDGQILTAPADGCDSECDPVANWRPIHNLFAEGSDFALTIALANVEAALSEAHRQIVLVGNEDSYTIYGDVEYERICGRSMPLN